MTATSAPIAAGQPTAGRPPDGLPPNGPPLAPALPVAEPAAVVVASAQRRRDGRIRLARGIASAATGQLARDLVAIALLAATVIVFFWPLLAEGQVAYENDTRIFYYPLFARLSQAVKSGSLPLWSPQIFTGYPVFADGESGSLYPFHLLAMLFLPVETAFTALRPLRFFQAALFTFLFCRSLGLGRFGAVVGALAFAFSGFAVAQMHHTNISTAAVWLPLVLTFAELALKTSGRPRYAFALLAGVAMGMEGLVIHVQVVLMSASLLGLYCLYRVIAGPIGHGDGPFTRLIAWMDRHPRWHLGWAAPPAGRLSLAASVVGLAGIVGAGLSAVQLLPLYELGTFSFRGGGVDYGFASQYSLPPVQLISLLLPDFFVINGQYWGLWSRWEVFAYAGIAPLALAVLGLVVSRRRVSVLFLLLGVAALATAMGEYSPFHIHRTLASLPGFAVLRAPGRFVFVFTFCVAMLAALGADALRRHFDRATMEPGGVVRRNAMVRGAMLSALILLLQLVAMAVPLGLSLASVVVQTQKDQAVAWLQATFLRMRGFDARFTVEHLYQFLLSALDVTQPTTMRQLALLFSTVALLVLWDRLRRFGRLWQLLLVLVIAVDLIGFGQRFHPTMPYDTLAEPSGVARFLEANPGLYRVFTQQGARDEPNRLLGFAVTEANGYSSLQPTRHLQYAALAEYAPNRLLDLMNARYYVVKNFVSPQASFNLASFNPRKPLLSSTGRNPAGSNGFLLNNAPADSLRVVSTLRWSATVATGTEVAKITATDADGKTYAFSLQAGVHTSEWAWERPDLREKLPHRLAPVAFTWQQTEGRAPPFPAHLYYAEFPFPRSVWLTQVDVVFTHPVAQVDLFGLAAFNDDTKDLEQLDQRKLVKFRQVYADPDEIVYENQDYLPRAFLVPSAVVQRPGDEILTQMAHGDWSPERFVILEEQFDTSPLAPPARASDLVSPIRFNKPQGTEISSGPGTVSITRMDGDDVRLRVDAKQNAMLVLADLMYPGWNAAVDGRPARIYRADYLFRAVYVPAGQHTVTFAYRPRSFRAGMLLTLAAVAGTAGGLWWLAFGGRRRSEPLPPGALAATMESPGSTPTDAAAADADGGIHAEKGPVTDGRQESKGHPEEEHAEGSDEGREEEVARPSSPFAEAASGHSG